METAEPPFAALTRRIQRSDAAAFESLFREIQPGLKRFAASLVADGADDFVQEAFVRIWERRESLDPGRSVKALLYQTVRNLALNRIRDTQTRATLLRDEGLEAHASVANPDEHVDYETVASRLRACIRDLPDRQREVLALTRDQHMTHEEAALAMGVAPRTVNNHLVRALKTLRDRLREFDPSIC